MRTIQNQQQESTAEASQPGGWLTARQAAAYIGYASCSLRRWCNAGLIRHAKAPGKSGEYRFRREWLDEFLLARTSAPDALPNPQALELKVPARRNLELPASERMRQLRRELSEM